MPLNISGIPETGRSTGRKRRNGPLGNRGAVAGGKQLDGFINLLARAAVDMGIPKEYIFLKGAHLPGYFRPTTATRYFAGK
ncbi:MAG: hypothetical protein H6559_37890 [Lewinellaceae bacterium]|nr:hypothetical protein [Lewinellaceae bacterium]